MKIIIPLAGPDFERGDITKAEEMVNGQPLLRIVLESRSWWRDKTVCDDDLIFVLQNSSLSRYFAENMIVKWYPSAKTVFLPNYTFGAAFTALAGVAILDPNADEILCIDLVDILYDATCNPTKLFKSDTSLGGLALTFNASDEIYSYLKLDEEGHVVEVAEKKVISSHASAGTYFFRNGKTYLTALSHCLAAGDKYTHNGLHYVCPVYNGVIACGQRVDIETVSNVNDVKIHTL